MYKYTKKGNLKAGTVWRFTPPQDAIDAGVVRRQTVTGFPVPDTNPNSPKTYGKGYWHMNLNIPKKSLGTMSKVTSKLTCGPNGYPNKSSMLMG